MLSYKVGEKEMSKAITIIRGSDWYKGLIEDLKAIFTEKYFNAREEILEMKWMMGKRILREEKKGITKIIKNVAFDTGFSEREMWRCVEFTREWPGKLYHHAISRKPLPEGKNCSWHKMANKYLPSAGSLTQCQGDRHKWEKVPYWRCKDCRKKMFSDPNMK
jgi:hypothetical protein